MILDERKSKLMKENLSYKLIDKVKARIHKYFPPQFYGKYDPEISRFKFFAIRGFPKSGTNWLSNLMNLHPLICSSGEFGFTHLAEAKEHINQKSKWTVCNKPSMKGRLDGAFGDMIKGLMIDNTRIVSSLNNKLWIGDKTPAPAYPPTILDSKCLYIVRDVRDITVSRAYHLLRVNGVWGLEAFPKMIEKMEKFGGNLQYFKDRPEQLLDDLDWVRSNVRIWVKSVEQVLGDEARTLQQTYPNYHIHTVRYEDLYTDVESERKRCYEFLGLNPNEALPLDSGKIKTSPGFSKERPQEFYRKGIVGDWKNYFSEEAEEIVLEEASDVLKKIGYLE